MKKISNDILTSLKEGYLEPKFDSAKSFYNKAMTDESNNKLYSYGTLVAEVVDNKPVIHNAQSATTVRHIKEFLRQKGFEDEVIVQAIKDFKKQNMNESFDSVQYWGSKNQFGYTIRQLRVDYDNRTFETGSFKQSVDHKVSNREIDRKIEELEALGFTNLNKQNAEADLERTEELYKNTPDEKHRKAYDNAKFNAKKNGVVKEGVKPDEAAKMVKTLKSFKDGNASMKDVIKALGVDLLDSDIEALEDVVDDYKKANPKYKRSKENIKEGVIYVLQGKYDTSWEDLVEYEDYKEAKADYRAYEENEKEYPHRLIQRRVKSDKAGHRKLGPNSDREKVTDDIEVMNYKGTYIVSYRGHADKKKEFDNQEDAFAYAEKLKKSK